MTIKMSDTLELPLYKDQGGVLMYVKETNGNIVFVSNEPMADAAILAINEYDDNQARIAELEGFIRRYQYRIEAREVAGSAFIEKLLRGNND